MGCAEASSAAELVNAATTEEEAEAFAELEQRLSAAMEGPLAVVRMVEVEQRLDTKSRPYVLRDDVGARYVVKGRGAGRSTFNDQVVGRLGMAFGAAVAQVTLVDVPQELIDARWVDLPDLVVGVAHGSAYIPELTDVERAILYSDRLENRSRFASLAILYGWCQVDEDHQFAHGVQPPHLVHSFDHGDFFPRGPAWTPDSLNDADACRPDTFISIGAGLAFPELRQAAIALNEITVGDIVSAVAAPPPDWGVSLDERVALTSYLIDRQRSLLDMLTAESGQE